MVKEVEGKVGASTVGDEGYMVDSEVREKCGDGFLEDEKARVEGNGRRATETRSEGLISYVV